MSDKKAPVVGKGSPRGMRYFTSRWSEFVQEIIPEHKSNPETGERKPFLRVAFEKRAKPDMLVGDGMLGSRNKSGSDTNANLYYSRLEIMDPGPEPKTEAEKKERLDHDLPAEFNDEENRNRLIIDTLRRSDNYKKTPQNNEFEVTAKLKELDWDPSELGAASNRYIKAGTSRPIARPDMGAPEDGDKEEAPAARGAKMGRKAVAAG